MRKIFKLHSFLLALMLIIFYSPIDVYSTNTLFFDDFESYPENSYPSSFYMIYSGTGNANQKVITAIGPSGKSTKVFRLEGAHYWSSEHGRDLPSNLPNILVVDAYIKPVAGVFPGAIGLRNPTGRWGTWISGVVFYYGKIEAIINDFHNRTKIGTYELNKWYRVTLEHNLRQRTYNVYINNVKVGSNLTMHSTLNPTHLDISAQNIGTNEIYYDDVGIYDGLPVSTIIHPVSTIIHENFEDGVLDPKITFITKGTFCSEPGIKNVTQFGSTKAFGFGRSTCGFDCFDNYTTTLKIDFGMPTFVSSISFKEIELFGNWGSGGKIFIDGQPLTGGDFSNPNFHDFGRLPYNDRTPDTKYRTKSFPINKNVNVIELKVWDITSSSEIFIDDLVIYGETKRKVKILQSNGG